MRKKFWRTSKVSKLIQQKKEDLKSSFFPSRAKGPSLEALRQTLPQSFSRWERGVTVLDRRFPIREGQGCVDFIVANKMGELILVFLKKEFTVEVISKLLPDYDWVQKNILLLAHLFPSAPKQGVLRLKVWCFGLEMASEVGSILTYLTGIRLKLFRCRYVQREGVWDWLIQPWQDSQKQAPVSHQLSTTPLPHALSQLPAKKEEARIPLTQEEINDLAGVTPGTEKWREEEITEPFFDPASLKLEA